MSNFAQNGPMVCVTGVPGCGKTYLSKILSESLDATYFDVGGWVKREGLYESYDLGSDTVDVDVDFISSKFSRIDFCKARIRFRFPSSELESFISSPG